MAKRGAAAIIIGNEVLSGKVRDENGPLLIRRLWEHRIPLRSLEVVPDEVDAIVEALVRAQDKAEHIFTSGGIGPTHDDVTVRAVALSLSREVIRLPAMEEKVRGHYGPSVSAEALRLADAPEGAELWEQEGTWYPVLTCEGMYLLPGVPQLFRVQLETVLSRLPRGQWHCKYLYLSAREPEVAAPLEKVAMAMPHVVIGSYPNFDPSVAHAVKLTVEHESDEEVQRALDALIQLLPASAILRVE